MTARFVLGNSRSHPIVYVIVAITIALIPVTIWADDQQTNVPGTDEDLEEELKYLQAETYVITASRVMEEIKRRRHRSRW